MLSKREISFLKSLHQKKYRQEHGLFIAEGVKVVEESLNSDFEVSQVFCTAESEAAWKKKMSSGTELRQISSRDLEQISALSTPQDVLAVAHVPKHRFDPDTAKNELVLVLEDVSDPGNLGTIIRVADWFGIGQVVCSSKTVDAYNPKVVQASMGSVFRVQVSYTDLGELLSKNKSTGIPVYGTVLEGENIYKSALKTHGYILLGNESLGLSKEISAFLTQGITVPKMTGPRKKGGSPDSLNVALSAAIVCSEFRRRVI